MLANIEDIPAQGILVLQRWRQLARDGNRPCLDDLAPQLIPPALLPWSMTYRRDADRVLRYGVVGEELSFLFRENPRGKVVLAYARPETREHRYAIIHQALDTWIPVWFSDITLFENWNPLRFGRLCLPTRTHPDPAQSGETLLLIYFPFQPLPEPRPRPMANPPFDPGAVAWCEERPV